MEWISFDLKKPTHKDGILLFLFKDNHKEAYMMVGYIEMPEEHHDIFEHFVMNDAVKKITSQTVSYTTERRRLACWPCHCGLSELIDIENLATHWMPLPQPPKED